MAVPCLTPMLYTMLDLCTGAAKDSTKSLLAEVVGRLWPSFEVRLLRVLEVPP